MSAEEELRESDAKALENSQIISHVTGKKFPIKTMRKLKGLTATGFLTVLIIVFVVIFNSGTLIPSALSERLVEETDMQYADAVESKKIVFQQAMAAGELPDNTIQGLKDKGVLVGYMQDGNFVEGNKVDRGLVLKMGDKITTANDFIAEVSTDTALYDAFNYATYSRAAYYYDEAGSKVFEEEIGTSRHNYVDKDADFYEVMSEKMKNGGDIAINSVSVTKNDDGEYEYNEDGLAISSRSGAEKLVEAVSKKNPANSIDESAINSADVLNIAETDVRNKRSALFYSLIMEPISQMKAEDGNDVLNQVMNYLTSEETTEVLDVKTRELVRTRASALEAPDLYAILSGEKVDMERAGNYSSDRILKTVENETGASGQNAITSTTASTDKKAKGVIGRLLSSGVETATDAIMKFVTPAVSKSLVDNSFENIKGMDAGEFLAEGAVNTGRMLAQASGGTAGDAEAVTEYARLNSEIIAMDAAADRMNRSPFDITSKNTFLGSIIYKLAVSSHFGTSNSVMGHVSSVMGVGAKSMASILAPGVYADESEGYLSSFGDCETIGVYYDAVGSASCAQIATFDTSTLNDPYGDSGFKKFVEENTTLSGGTRTIKDGSVLAQFILYNNRSTPFGVTDGGILDSLNNDSGSLSVVSSVLELIENFVGSSDEEKEIATGAAFVNSSSNSKWQTYKYAQRYVSLARATAALKQYSGGSTAYDNIKYFEGGVNPVIAYINKYYSVANR